MATPRTPRGVRCVRFLKSVAPLLLVIGCAGLSVPGAPAAAPYRAQDRALLPRDAQGLAMSQTVARQIIRLMERGIRDQREPDACVRNYRVWVRASDSARMVDVYTLTLAEDDSSNALNIWSGAGEICPIGVPSLHGHVWRDEVLSQPSGTDSATLIRSRAPFDLLAFRLNSDSSVGVRVYWNPERPR